MNRDAPCSGFSTGSKREVHSQRELRARAPEPSHWERPISTATRTTGRTTSSRSRACVHRLAPDERRQTLSRPGLPRHQGRVPERGDKRIFTQTGGFWPERPRVRRPGRGPAGDRSRGGSHLRPPRYGVAGDGRSAPGGSPPRVFLPRRLCESRGCETSRPRWWPPPGSTPTGTSAA
jgi:hypothetical protein